MGMFVHKQTYGHRDDSFYLHCRTCIMSYQTILDIVICFIRSGTDILVNMCVEFNCE